MARPPRRRQSPAITASIERCEDSTAPPARRALNILPSEWLSFNALFGDVEINLFLEPSGHLDIQVWSEKIVAPFQSKSILRYEVQLPANA